MTLPRQLYQIDYDQFQRYAAITVLLKPLLETWMGEAGPLRILEVGSHSLNLLPAFLSPLSIEVVRADLQPQYAGDLGPYVTIKQDQPLPFADGAFDVVIAMEVLEHVPPQARASVVREWSRVAARGVFFTCPNGEVVADQERRADADFQARHGRVHPWLEEHYRYGRPTLEEVQQLCRQAKLTCHRFHNSPLAEWLPLLLVTERIFEVSDHALFARFNQLINERPFRALIDEPAYRSMYAGFKTSVFDQQAQALWQNHRRQVADAEPLDPTRLLAAQLSKSIIQQRRQEVKETELTRLQQQNAELQQQLSYAEQELTWHRWQKTKRRASTAAIRQSPLHHARLADLLHVETNRWYVTGTKPTFEWDCEHDRGWHRITLSGQVIAGHSAILSLDYGHGFSGEHVVRLGTWSSRHNSLYVNAYFHHPVVKMRLVPCQGQSPVVIDQLRVESITPSRVAFQGMGRLLSDLIRFPRLTSSTLRQSSSWLRLGMQQTMNARNLPHGARNEYQRWLLAHRPTPAQRQQLIARHRHNPSKVVAFLRMGKDDQVELIDATLRSLALQDDCRWEVWCAVEANRQQTMQSWDVIKQLGVRVHWLTDGPDRGLTGLLNECLEESQADWFFQLHVGDIFEPDAALQFLETARLHPHAVFLYADEGLLLPHEGEAEPMFKSTLTPAMIRQRPSLLGEAIALHGPTLLRLGGFNAGYEGALVVEYLYRALQADLPGAQVCRVLLHHQPRPTVSKAVLKVIERIQEAYSSEYHISYEKVAEPAFPIERATSIDVQRQVITRKDGARC